MKTLDTPAHEAWARFSHLVATDRPLVDAPTPEEAQRATDELVGFVMRVLVIAGFDGNKVAGAASELAGDRADEMLTKAVAAGLLRSSYVGAGEFRRVVHYVPSVTYIAAPAPERVSNSMVRRLPPELALQERGADR